MKNFVKILAVLLVFCTVFACFAGCTGEKGEVKLVVILNDDIDVYEVDTKNLDMTYLVDLMNYVADNNAEFTFEASAGFMTSLNGYVPSGNEFVAIYTDLELNGIPYYDVSWGTVDYGGKAYGSASKGITELPLNGGVTYILTVSTFTI